MRATSLTWPDLLQIEPHPQIRSVTAEGAKTLPVQVIEDAFRHQYDRTLNVGDFRAALAKLDGWYADRGIFGQVSRGHIRFLFWVKGEKGAQGGSRA